VRLRTIYRGLAALLTVGLAVTQGSVAQAGQPQPTTANSLTATAPAGGLEDLCRPDDGAQWAVERSPDNGAAVVFCQYDELLWLCDIGPDHHPVARFYWSKDAQLHVVHRYPGNGFCEPVDLDIPEDGHINFRACNYEETTAVSCSPFTGRVSAG
jgi:hypothetical protein